MFLMNYYSIDNSCLRIWIFWPFCIANGFVRAAIATNCDNYKRTATLLMRFFDQYRFSTKIVIITQQNERVILGIINVVASSDIPLM